MVQGNWVRSRSNAGRSGRLARRGLDSRLAIMSRQFKSLSILPKISASPPVFKRCRLVVEAAAAVGPLAISWLGLFEMTWLGLGKWRGQLHGGGLSSWTGATFLSQTAGIIAWKWSSTRPLFFRRTTFDIAAAADCDSGLTWDTNRELKLLPATICTRFCEVEPTEIWHYLKIYTVLMLTPKSFICFPRFYLLFTTYDFCGFSICGCKFHFLNL